MIKEQTKSYTKKQIFKTLHPWVRQWFDSKFDDFTPAQKKSIIDINNGNNILISSPTGSGKTLTAFLSIISKLTSLAEKDQLEDKVYCIYISPLKARDNDIEKNLDEPLSEIEKISDEQVQLANVILNNLEKYIDDNYYISSVIIKRCYETLKQILNNSNNTFIQNFTKIYNKIQ